MTTTPTVRDLFVSAGSTSAGLQLPPVPDGLASLVTGFEWNGLGERVLDLLDLNVVDILIGGWKQHREVRRQLRATAADPARTAIVNLLRHTLTSSHAPSIELRVHGRRLMTLSFPIELSFDIDAVELTLRGGAVRQVRPGAVKVRGTVKIENTAVLQRELTPMPLPGRITIDAGVPPAPATTSPADAGRATAEAGHGAGRAVA
jgi:hypothetical protein